MKKVFKVLSALKYRYIPMIKCGLLKHTHIDTWS